MEEKILQLTEEDMRASWDATSKGWYLPEVAVHADFEFCVALVVRCAGDGSIPNGGELVGAALARAFIASRGVEMVVLPPERDLWRWPPRKPLFLWAAVWRVAGRESSAGMKSPLAAFLRLLRPWWRTGGGDDPSCVFAAQEIVGLWRPARGAWTQSSPVRAEAQERGERAYAQLPVEYREFVDALAPFGPAAFRKVLGKKEGW